MATPLARNLALILLATVATATPLGGAEPLPGPMPPIVSFKADFDRFWTAAQNQDLDHQLKSWDELVEKPHQAFYDGAVWNKKNAPHWEAAKRKALAKLFKVYSTLQPKIQIRFDTFESTFGAQVAAFRKLLPDAPFKMPVYAALSPTFDGTTAVLDETAGSPVLAFAIDTMAAGHEREDVLYARELFHAYHWEVSGIKEDGHAKYAFMTSPLWAEGLATYVAALITGASGNGTLLLDPLLDKVSPKDIAWLAKQYIKIAEKPAPLSKTAAEYAQWFSAASPKSVRQDLPRRCGALLGFYIVKQVAKTNNLVEMAHWKADEARPRVLSALKQLP